ncbi:GDNF family receptor alpha-4 [Acipenser ruthenus]|uniref:GDNF family receptor alpha-4 n=1 Tax=Acipenser ruthenus TaxID=7906 RepID=A0A444V0D0_ACIRT|nr:GDNF family receptor alpha-4 [Acipenser ruthenus]
MCNSSYRVLEYCAAEEAVSPLGPEARKECVTAEAALAQSPLLRCKCHRGNRREEHCLTVYWTVRFSNSYYELESSPYEDLETDQMWAIQNSRLAAIVSGSSIVTEWDNPCLEAAQACGLYEKCGNLRSEYVLACTKRVSGTDTCNRQKCHKALRRFLDRVPEEYSFAVLFCQCSNALCGERRRMAIVPSCSFEEKEKPNCLYLQQICLKDELCKSRLADFHSKCQPSPISTTGCLRENGAACLKSYSGLIGYYELESSPYEDLETDQMWAIQNSRLAAIVSGSSIVTEWDNPCLEAAQACGLYEKCGNLRSEYVLACTKRVSGTDTCNRQKCHKALRRFLDRVPEEYSFAVLFCQCSNALCGERRRMAIVPSCSFEEKEKPNCLYLQQICLKDELCKSRLADFHSKCQPSPISTTGCLRENGAACLKSYSGLIGTIMTPNYQSNSSSEVSQWCSCEGSGNKQQECDKILTMFTQNICLGEQRIITATASPMSVAPISNLSSKPE